MRHLTRDEIEAMLDGVLVSPKDNGTPDLIVRRPRENEGETVAEPHPVDG